MSISTTGNRESHLGDGVSTSFPFPYPFFANTDIHVFVDGVELITGFTVSGAGTGSGTVTFMVAPAVGAVIVLVRIPSNLQPTVISENDEFPAKIVEGMADRVTLQVQRLSDLVGRSLTLSDADSSSASLTLPTPIASSFLGWNATGDAIVNYSGLASVGVSAAMTPVVGAASLALARAAMGITPSNIGAVADSLANQRLLGRYGAGTGQVQPITLGAGLSLSGGGVLSAVAAPSGGVFYENDQAVAADYSITAGKNALSAGPITINSGVTVTVPSGSTWTVA